MYELHNSTMYQRAKNLLANIITTDALRHHRNLTVYYFTQCELQCR